MPQVLLVSVLLSAIPVLIVATDYYVKPTDPPDVPCPGSPCYTLQEYATNQSHYLMSVSNVTVNLLPGNHKLYSTSLVVASVSNFAFIGYSMSNASDVNITCSSDGVSTCGFYVKESFNVTLEGFSFTTQIQQTTGLVSVTSTAILSVLNVALCYTTLTFYGGVSDVLISHVLIDGGEIHSTSGLVGNTSIIHSRVVNVMSNGFYFFTDNTLTQDSYITMKECTFEDSKSRQYYFGDTIHIRIEPTSFNVQINIDHVDVNKGNVYLYLGGRSSSLATVRITDSYIGESVSTGLSIASLDGPDFNSSGTAVIANCTIEGHLRGGISVDYFIGYADVLIEDTIVRANVLDPLTDNGRRLSFNFAAGSGMSVRGNLQLFGSPNVCKPNSVTLNNVSFEFNNSTGVLGPFSVVVALYNTKQCVRFTNCRFYGNTGTPIFASSNPFSIAGDLEFLSNTAYQGGAMTFVGYPPDKTSYVLVQADSNIYIEDNYAVNVGGAVYVADTTLQSGFFVGTELLQPCFFSAGDNVSITFVNNRAGNGGDAIYGPFKTLGQCKDTYILNFVNGSNSSLSIIASNPSRVCICSNGRPDCTSIFLRQARYPGETFSLSAVLVGEAFGSVAGSVYTQFLPLENGAESGLAGLQQSQAVTQHNCTTLLYTIYSSNEHDVLVLKSNEQTVTGFPDYTQVNQSVTKYRQDGIIGHELLTLPIYINVTLRQCPLGFQRSGDPAQCVCNTRLDQAKLSCNINTQTVQRSGTVWVNASFVGNSSNGVIVHKFCPFHYCKQQEVNVDLENPDSQCAFRHSGTLCGSCQSGMSLALGSVQCLSCSNYFIFLVIPFAIAGLALVFFIKLLNFTVSVGTINGLILYANIVGGTRTLWFPPGTSSFLGVFLAWLNLDLGIETCFFDGLDAYGKTWLQFVFPVYLWTIAGVIIVGSHYSIRMCRIFGNNSVPMLSTLFLLSYAKLLRTIITALSFTTLAYPDGSYAVVWSVDANIRYFSLPHTLLFLVAVAFLLLLLFFTVVLLFGQCLQRTNHRVCGWVSKMKPIFDACFAPFKDEHRFWVGVLLLVRCFILLTFSFTAVNAPDVNFLVVATTVLVLLQYSAINIPAVVVQRGQTKAQGLASKVGQFVGPCYREWYLSLLENSFILNLGVLATGTLYIHLNDGNQMTLVNISVGVVFGQFFVLTISHLILYFPVRKVARLLRLRPRTIRNDLDYRDLDQGADVRDAHVPDRVTLRESILEYIDA